MAIPFNFSNQNLPSGGSTNRFSNRFSSSRFSAGSSSGLDLNSPEVLYALARMNGGMISEVADEIVHPEKSFLSRAWDSFKGGAVKVLDTLAIPQQVVAGIISPDITVREAIEENISPSEVIWGEQDPNAPVYKKIGGFAVRLATDILLDPTTYLTAGYGQGLLGVRATTKIPIAGKMIPVTDTGTAWLTSAWNRQRDGVTKTLLKIARGNGKKYQEFVDEFVKFRPDLTDAVRAGAHSDELEKAFINKHLENLVDQDLAKESLSKLITANPSLAKTYLDQGGIKYFGKSIIAGQKLSEAFNAIPGVSLMDEITAPTRRLIGATFNRAIDFKHGRIPEEVLNLEDKWKDFGRRKLITSTSTLKNIVDSFQLTPQEAELLMGNLELGIIPADERLARAWSAARNFDFNELSDLRNAGYKINNKENHVPHVLAEPVQSRPVPFTKPPKTSTVAGLERKLADTVAEAELAGYKFEKNPFIAMARRSVDNIRAITSSEYVKELGEKFGVAASEAPSGWVPIKIQGIKNVQQSSAKGGVLSLSDFIRSTTGEELYFHPAIADRASSFVGSVINDEATSAWLKKLDSFNNIWKASQTVVWPAFHGRNAISNVLQNFLDIGVHALDPKKNAMSLSIIKDDAVARDLEGQFLGVIRRQTEFAPEIEEIPIKFAEGEVTKPITRSRVVFDDRQFIDAVRSAGSIRKDKIISRMGDLEKKAREVGYIKESKVDWDAISDEVREMFGAWEGGVDFDAAEILRNKGSEANLSWVSKRELKEIEYDSVFSLEEFFNIPTVITDEKGKIIRKVGKLPLKKLAEARDSIDRTLNLSNVYELIKSGKIDEVADIPLNLSPEQESLLTEVADRFRRTDGSKKSFIESLTGRPYRLIEEKVARDISYGFNTSGVDELYSSITKILGKEEYVEQVVERAEVPVAFTKVFKGEKAVGVPEFVDLPGTAEARKSFSELMMKPVITDVTGKQWTNGEIRSILRETGVALNPHFTGGADISRSSRDFVNELFGEDNKLGLLNLANPFSKENLISRTLKSGKTLARIVEDHARIVNFLTNLEKTGDVALAAERTKMFLFDYDNISDFERTWLKRFIPFYCVPEDSLALTKIGWKHYSEITVGEKILTYNNDKDEYEWQPCLEVASFEHDQELMVIENTRHKIRFTPEHRWVTERTASTTVRPYGIYKYPATRSIKRGYQLTTQDNLKVSSTFKGNESEYSVDDARLLGWLLTDGYFRSRGNHIEAMIYQSPKKFLEEVKIIAGGKPRNPHPVSGVVCVPVLKERLVNLKVLLKRNKSTDDWCDFVGSLSREAMEAMYDAMYKADGTTSLFRHQDSFTCQLDGVAKTFEMLATLLGKRVVRNPRGFYISNTSRFRVGRQKNEHYAGVVWCPRTDNGTWVMKQGNMITITGNTFTRKNLELQARSLVEVPGRISAIFTTFQNIGEVMAGGELTKDEESILPDWMKGGIKFAISRKGQHIGLITSLGTPLEAAAQSLQPRQLVSSLTPLLRVPLEMTTGQDIFRGKSISSVTDADAYRYAPKVIKDFIGFTEIHGTTKEGKKYTDYRSLRPERMHLLNNMPFASRTVSLMKTMSDVSDKNLGFGHWLLKAWTGINLDDVDLERAAADRERELRDELTKILDDAGVVATFKRTYIPKK